MNLCERAADRLERYGWVQKDLGRPNEAACLVGSIWFEAQSQLTDEGISEYSAALRAVRDVLGMDPSTAGSPDLLDWNDLPGRTQDEVVECLRLASKELSK